MKITQGEFHVDFEPESEYEILVLKRLDRPRVEFTTELIQAPGDRSHPGHLQFGAKLRINIPRPDWGT